MSKIIYALASGKKQSGPIRTSKDLCEAYTLKRKVSPRSIRTVEVSTIQQRSGEDMAFYKHMEKMDYYVVCDGHGAPGKLCDGHIAYTVIYGYNTVLPLHEYIYSEMVKSNWDIGNAKHTISDAIQNFDRLCYKHETFGGTCIAIILVINSRFIYVAHLGDSRACIWMDNGEDINILYESDDHTPHSEYNRIISSGYPVYDGRVNGDINISRALGDWKYKIDQTGGYLLSRSSPVLAIPKVYSIDSYGCRSLKALICSDGIYDSGLTSCDYIQSIRKNRLTYGISSTITNYAAKKTDDDVTCIYIPNLI
jgi:serine/threonine protein phosphatase PrpC